MLRIGNGHEIRKLLFQRGIREGRLDVEEAESLLPPELFTAAERWLFYFSLRASEVVLHDSQGNVVTPDEVVPEHVRLRPRRQRALEAELEGEAPWPLAQEDA